MPSAQAFDTHSGDAIFVFVVTARWRHWYKHEAYVAPLEPFFFFVFSGLRKQKTC